MNRFSVQAATISTTILVLKAIFTAMRQGQVRFTAGCRPPEDQSFLPLAGEQSFDGTAKAKRKQDDPKFIKAKDIEQRWSRIVMNDLENIPIGLVLIWAGLVAAPASQDLHSSLSLIFAGSRVLHTITYSMSLQPHRAICWSVGVICSLVMSLNLLAGAFL